MAEIETNDRLTRRTPAVPMEPVFDPAAWTASDLASDQGWVHELTESDVAELDALVILLSERITDILELKETDIDLNKIRNDLVKDGHESLVIEKVSPTVEDSFLLFMNKNEEA